ncbi:unnamed protein product, partial [Didymodactylos carnosus]
QQILERWDELQIENIPTKELLDKTTVDLNVFMDDNDEDIVTETIEKPTWYSKCVDELGIKDDIFKWIQDKAQQQTINMNTYVDPLYKLLDLDKVEENDLSNETELKIQRIQNTQKSIQYSHRQITYKQYVESRIACEIGLTSVYARYTILNMLKIWTNSNDKKNNLFPLQGFGDWHFITKLLRFMDYHYVHTSISSDETIDRMKILANSIVQVETNELLKQTKKITRELFYTTAPLLYHLQIDIITQCIRFISQPSFLQTNDETLNEQTIITQPNLNFVLRILKLFLELISNSERQYIQILVEILFPNSLIDILFDLFLLVPKAQSK